MWFTCFPEKYDSANQAIWARLQKYRFWSAVWCLSTKPTDGPACSRAHSRRWRGIESSSGGSPIEIALNWITTKMALFNHPLTWTIIQLDKTDIIQWTKVHLHHCVVIIHPFGWWVVVGSTLKSVCQWEERSRESLKSHPRFSSSVNWLFLQPFVIAVKFMLIRTVRIMEIALLSVSFTNNVDLARVPLLILKISKVALSICFYLCSVFAKLNVLDLVMGRQLLKILLP